MRRKNKENKKESSFILRYVLIFVFLTLLILYVQMSRVSLKQNQLQTELNIKLSATPTKYLYFIPIPPSNSVSIKKMSDKNGWTTYENYIGGFSINFPNNLYFYERNVKSTSWDSTSGSICLTDEKITDEYEKCLKGLQVFYAVPYIDGKGGMGCGEFETKIQIGNNFYKTCMNNEKMNGGGNFYLKHPAKKSEIGFSAIFSEQVDKQLVLEILKSFRFIN